MRALLSIQLSVYNSIGLETVQDSEQIKTIDRLVEELSVNHPVHSVIVLASLCSLCKSTLR